MDLKNLYLNKFLLWKEQKKITLSQLMDNEVRYIVTHNLLNNTYSVYSREKTLSVFLHNRQPEISLPEEIKPEPHVVLGGDQDLMSFPWIDPDIKAAIIIGQDEKVLGVLENPRSIAIVVSKIKNDNIHLGAQTDYYKKIIDAIEEEILVTDEYGFIQFVNPWAVKVSGSTREDLVGRHMLDYEKACIADTTSIAMDVLKNHKKVHKMMKMNTGRMLIATGIPIYDRDGRLTNALSTSKDVDEIASLFQALTHQEHDGLVIKQQQEIIQLKERIIGGDFIMVSEAMQELQKMIARIAPKEVTVLIEGESGVGKEVVCSLIHKLSPNYDRPMIKINCGAIPEHLLESELFGYEPGAFTGANKSGKIGLIELANNSTIFLDEIGEMPLLLQVKLLEFLQDRNIIRVGGVKKIPIKTRVVAATNRNLRRMVAEGTFRGDLYYRLNVLPLTVPPLRQRHADIIPLAMFFMEKYNRKYGLNRSFSRELMQALLEYDWPGNVRELMHIVERMVLVSENNRIDSIAFKDIVAGNSNPVAGEDVAEKISLKQAKDSFEFQLVRNAYEKHRSTYKAAAALGINQSTVVKILKKNEYRKNDSKWH